MTATADGKSTIADIETYVTSAAAFQSLVIDPSWSPNVVAHLQTISEAASLVSSFSLDDEIEAAPIFTP